MALNNKLQWTRQHIHEKSTETKQCFAVLLNDNGGNRNNNQSHPYCKTGATSCKRKKTMFLRGYAMKRRVLYVT
jgi:hypothetical protein